MFVVERMPNAKEIVQKSITNSRAIMNNSERVKEQKKSRILGRIVKAKVYNLIIYYRKHSSQEDLFQLTLRQKIYTSKEEAKKQNMRKD